MTKKIYLQLFLILILITISSFIYFKYLKKIVQKNNLKANVEQTINSGESLIEDLKYLSTDKDGNETGEIEFKVKANAKFQSRDGKWFSQKPLVVDSKRTPMTKDTLIGNGSIVKVAFDIVPYSMMSSKTCSVSLRMKGVQVLQLVEYQGDLFEDEDGFIAKAADDNIGEVAVEADF